MPPVSQPEAPAAGDTPAPTKTASSEPPPPPSSVLEALQQRLEKYESAANQAKEEGNGSKARRMGRIVKVDILILVYFSSREMQCFSTHC